MFRLRVDPDKAFRSKVLGRWKSSMRDLRWMWPTVEIETAKVHRDMFDEEGPGWRPLSLHTVNMRATAQRYYAKASTEGPNRRILHWTHALRDSLSTRFGNALSVRFAGRRMFTWGTRHHAAHDLHHGSPGNPYIPARPLLRPELSVEAIASVLPAKIVEYWNRR